MRRLPPLLSVRALVASLALAALCGLAAPAAAESPILWTFKDNNAVRFYNQGVQAFNQGRPDAAVKSLRKALGREENNGVVWLLLAEALLRAGETQESLELMQELNRRAPGKAAVLASLSDALFATGEFEPAAARAVAAIEANPDEVEGWFALLNARRRLGTLQSLTRDLEQEYERKPRPEIACLQVLAYVDEKQAEPARHAMSLCAAAEGESFVLNARGAMQGAGYAEDDSGPPEMEKGYTLLNAAIEARNAQDWSQALTLVNRAERAGAPSVHVRLLRAEAQYWLGHYDEATADMDVILADTSWIEVNPRGDIGGVLTKAEEEEVRDRVRAGAAIAVLLAARSGGAVVFEDRLAEVREALGDGPHLRAAEAEALRITGSVGRAWEVLSAAYAQGDDPIVLGQALQGLASEGVAVASDEQIDAVVRRATPAALFNLAIAATQANLDGRCLRILDGLDEGGDAEAARERFADRAAELADKRLGLAYSCAVRTRAFEAADRYGARAGWGDPVQTGDMWNHALALARASRWEDVLVQVRDRGMKDRPDPVGDVRTFEIQALVELERLDEAKAVASEPGVDAMDRARVGLELARAGRKEDTKAMLEGVCGAIEGPNAEICADALAWAKEE